MNLKNTKSQGMALNTIVIFMILIVVGVLIVMFFITGFGSNKDNLNNIQDASVSCENLKGTYGTSISPDKYNDMSDTEKEEWRKILNCYVKK
jgi:uncharacterized membrane protein